MSGTEHGEAYPALATLEAVLGAVAPLVHDGDEREQVYECPLCGDGYIHSDQVASYNGTPAEFPVGVVGVQCYGVGEGHIALEKAFRDAPAEIRALRKDLASALESLRGMRGLLKEALSCVPSNDNPDSCDYIDELRDRIAAAITATSGGTVQ
jgi:hypothetical protein